METSQVSEGDLTMMLGQTTEIILASASKTRADLLRGAGLVIQIVPANVDEDAVKESLRAEGATADRVAEALSDLKALKISHRFPDALVIETESPFLAVNPAFALANVAGLHVVTSPFARVCNITAVADPSLP